MVFHVHCGGHWHSVVLEDDGGEVVVRFPEHKDIEKDTLIATMRGDVGGCPSVVLELTGQRDDGRLSKEMMRALANRKYKRARILLEAGANPNFSTRRSARTVLLMQIENRRRNAVKLLLEYGADPDKKSAYEETPLIRAAGMGLRSILRMLLEAGADPNAKAETDHTALHSAARANDSFAIDLLVQHGAEVNALTSFSTTPLHHAVRAENTEAVIELLKHGADTGIRNSSGDTALSMAKSQGSRESARIHEILSRAARGEAPE